MGWIGVSGGGGGGGGWSKGQTIGGEGCKREKGWGVGGRGRERGLERAINAMFTCRPPSQFKEKEH